MHHDWEKNHKIWENVVLPCLWYGHEGFGLKLFMQTLLHKIKLDNRGGLEVQFDVIWSTIHEDKEKLDTIQNKKEESRNNSLSGFMKVLNAGYGSFNEHCLGCHFQGDYTECLPKPAFVFERLQIYNKEQSVMNYHAVISIALHS